MLDNEADTASMWTSAEIVNYSMTAEVVCLLYVLNTNMCFNEHSE